MTESAPAQPTEEKETGRLEALSDGVFAVAITLMVFQFKVPELTPTLANSQSLSRELLQQWPSYIAFVTSFFTILVMWVHHHALFKNVSRCDAWVHFANGSLLRNLCPDFYLLQSGFACRISQKAAAAVNSHGFRGQNLSQLSRRRATLFHSISGGFLERSPGFANLHRALDFLGRHHSGEPTSVTNLRG